MINLKNTYKFQIRNVISKSLTMSGDGNADIILTKYHNKQYDLPITDIHIFNKKITQVISRPNLEVSNIASSFKGDWIFVGVRNYYEANRQMSTLFTYRYDGTKYIEDVLSYAYDAKFDYGSQMLVNYRKNLLFVGFSENYPAFGVEILEYNDKRITKIGDISLPGDIEKFKLMDINTDDSIIAKCKYRDNTTSISIYSSNDNKYRNVEVIDLPYDYYEVKNVKAIDNTIFALITQNGKEDVYTITKYNSKWKIKMFNIEHVIKSLSDKELKRYTVNNIETSKSKSNNKLFISVFCAYKDGSRKNYILVYKKRRRWKYTGYIESPDVNDYGKKFDIFGSLMKVSYNGKKILTTGKQILDGSYETIYIHKYVTA